MPRSTLAGPSRLTLAPDVQSVTVAFAAGEPLGNSTTPDGPEPLRNLKLKSWLLLFLLKVVETSGRYPSFSITSWQEWYLDLSGIANVNRPFPPVARNSNEKANSGSTSRRLTLNASNG